MGLQVDLCSRQCYHDMYSPSYEDHGVRPEMLMRTVSLTRLRSVPFADHRPVGIHQGADGQTR